MIYKCPCCGKYLNTENIIASYDEITDTIVQVGGECNTCGKVRIDNWEFDGDNGKELRSVKSGSSN